MAKLFLSPFVVRCSLWLRVLPLLCASLSSLLRAHTCSAASSVHSRRSSRWAADPSSSFPLHSSPPPHRHTAAPLHTAHSLDPIPANPTNGRTRTKRRRIDRKGCGQRRQTRIAGVGNIGHRGIRNDGTRGGIQGQRDTRSSSNDASHASMRRHSKGSGVGTADETEASG